MSKKKTLRTNQDSAWKYILDCYFKEFMEFFYPSMAAQIDWTMKYEMLDKELQTIATEDMTGKRFVDKLIKVKMLEGKKEILLVHIEVQGAKDDEFPKRLFQYYCKLFIAHDQSIITLAIITDGNSEWHPKNYQRDAFKIPILNFNFQTNKLIDYKTQIQALSESKNPFAIVVLVHLAFLDTKNKPPTRGKMKFNLTYALYKKGYSRDDVLNLLRVIDWVLVLPKPLELKYKAQVHQLEEETKMNYMSSFEQIALEEGLRQGEEKGIEKGIQKGIEKGEYLGHYKTAKKLLAKGMPKKFVREITEISDADLEVLYNLGLAEVQTA